MVTVVTDKYYIKMYHDFLTEKRFTYWINIIVQKLMVWIIEISDFECVLDALVSKLIIKCPNKSVMLDLAEEWSYEFAPYKPAILNG